MVVASLIAFVTIHILYLKCYQFDYGKRSFPLIIQKGKDLFKLFDFLNLLYTDLNMKASAKMGVAKVLIWGVWVGISNHPSKWKIWVVKIGEGLIILFQIYDFPPYKGFLDAHAISHAIVVPVSYIWWSFIHDDSEYRTKTLMKKAK